MKKPDRPDLPRREEAPTGLREPAPPPAFGEREWIVLFFERYGFIIALSLTLAGLGLLLVNADDLLRTPHSADPDNLATEQEAASGPLGTDSPTTNASVSIMTEPTGSTVVLNGDTLGRAPVDASVRPGTYSLALLHKGYAPLDTVLTLQAGSMELSFSLRFLEPASEP